MNKPKKKKREITRVAMIAIWIFSLPFLLAALWNGWMLLRDYRQHEAMKSWVETPATLKSVELESRDIVPGRRRRRGGSGRYHQAVATYSYEYEGKPHQGNRVDLHPGSDSSDFHQRVYSQLKQALEQHSPIHCFVNPTDPTEAVLYRDLRASRLLNHAVISTLFGGVALFMLISAHHYWRKQQRKRLSTRNY